MFVCVKPPCRGGRDADGEGRLMPPPPRTVPSCCRSQGRPSQRNPAEEGMTPPHRTPTAAPVSVTSGGPRHPRGGAAAEAGGVATLRGGRRRQGVNRDRIRRDHQPGEDHAGGRRPEPSGRHRRLWRRPRRRECHHRRGIRLHVQPHRLHLRHHRSYLVF